MKPPPGTNQKTLHPLPPPRGGAVGGFFPPPPPPPPPPPAPPRSDELMGVFCARLLAAAPAVRPLLVAADVRRQKMMLLDAFVLVRGSLHDMDALICELRELEARHVAYGATPEHYIVVGEALI